MRVVDIALGYVDLLLVLHSSCILFIYCFGRVFAGTGSTYYVYWCAGPVVLMWLLLLMTMMMIVCSSFVLRTPFPYVLRFLR